MAYSDFTTLTSAKKQFGLEDETRDLFALIPEFSISEALQSALKENIPLALAIATEKARSEMIITPILLELRKATGYHISLFSGVDFTVDKKQGLKGVCDYIISRSSEQFAINAPVLMIVEAKNEDIKGGMGQCIAEMVAAQIFNQREGNNSSNVYSSDVYGVVTTGSNWRFLKLENTTVVIDVTEYFINQIDKIFGILLHLAS